MMSKDGHTYRYTGVGGMRSMAEWARTDATVLADEVPAASLAWHTSQRVGRIEKSGSGSSYLLFSDPTDELLGEYGAVLLAIPAPQVDALLRASALPVPDDLPTMEPVVAFAFPVPNDDASWSALAAGNFAPAGSRVVAWLARNSSKAGQRGPAGSDAVILVHSTPSFAGQARAEGWTKNRIRAEMADAVEATFKVTVPALARSQGLVHQWRYARVAETSGDGSAQAPSPSPSASPFITVSGETCLLAAGDWAVQGGRIQGAFESGTVAGGEILSRLEAKL
jgi:predicted NAD/FAD-dependent oxidoreductase